MLLRKDDEVAALSPAELRRLVDELLGEVTRLREENAALRDELARHKGLKGRPKIKPSGMERATAPRGKQPKRKARGGAKSAKPVVAEERVLSIGAPPGSRFKGYEDFIVQDLRLESRVIRYRRQRWLTPDRRTLVAPLPRGIQGHFGPELHRFVLLQHHQGQVTTERITAFLNSLGVAISKRQVVRLLTAKSTALVDEAKAVLRAGLESACWISVDDTGARHRAKNGVTTQIGPSWGAGSPQPRRALRLFRHQLLQEPAQLPRYPARRPRRLCPQWLRVRLHAPTRSRRTGDRPAGRASARALPR